jgi:hypothetical protein
MSVPSAARAALTFSSWFVLVGLAVCAALLVPSRAQAAVCPAGPSAIQSVSYTLNGITTVSDLTGNVNQGDIVQANFTVKPTCSNAVLFSLVSYLAPGPTWDPNTASQQMIFDQDTVSAPPGIPTSTRPIAVPLSCFQIDFVGGAPLTSFSPPSGTYSAQHRLIDADNGDPGCTPL